MKVDVRVLASTNCDLKEKVRKGEFREDLYYRLKVVEIELPPLRDRLEDIPLLVAHFCEKFKKSFKKKIEGVSNDVLRTFLEYDWPGNVRELEHALEHGFVLCRGKAIRVDHLPPEVREDVNRKKPVRGKPYTDNPRSILSALEKTGWNKAKAARSLGISRQTMYRKIDQHNLQIPAE